MDRAWPLTGRSEELRLVEAAVRGSRGRQGAVLVGSAGVGKTRIAREALTSARRRGMATKWVTATASAQRLPLGALAPLLGPMSGEPVEILHRATDLLLAGGAHRGCLLAVDDAHLLDDVSATLVHQLAVHRRAVVLLTVRSGEPAPDAVMSLWKDEHLFRIDVEPLSEAETATLLESVLEGQVCSTATARLWAMTRGNALFLRQLVDGELEAGRLGPVAGVWSWSGEPAMPPGLVDVVAARMGGLPEPVSEVVDLLALGEPIGHQMLVGMTGRGAVEEAEARGLVEVAWHGCRLDARLAHPLYGEVRREALGVVRGRRLRGRLATALAGTGARRADDLLRRAVYLLDSDLPGSSGLFARAGEAAMGLADFRLAERLARGAVAAGGGFGARLVLACCLAWLSRGEDAEAELAALTDEARTDRDRASVALPRAGNLFCTLGRPDEAEAVLGRAAAHVHDSDSSDILTAAATVFHAWLGRAEDAVGVSRRLLGRPGVPDPVAVFALKGLVAGLAVLGGVEEADRAAARGYELAWRMPDGPMLRLGIGEHHLLALRLAGSVTEASAVALERHKEAAEEVGPAPSMGVALLGHAALAEGRLGAAMRHLREARAGLVAGDVAGWDLRCLIALSQAQAQAGEVAAARETLEAMRARRHPGFLMFDPDVRLAEAWVAAGEGALTEAVAFAHGAAELARARRHTAYEVLALHAAVRLGDAGVGARLRQLASEVGGSRAAAAAAQASALAVGDGERLLAAAERFEAVGDTLAAADAAAQAAVALVARGCQGRGQAAGAEAQRLAEACGGARTPALLAASRPLPLTPREREIASLAARGLANREIAERLVVSVRTVEGHLYRVMAKLGVTDRRDLQRYLGPTAA